MVLVSSAVCFDIWHIARLVERHVASELAMDIHGVCSTGLSRVCTATESSSHRDGSKVCVL